VEDVYDSATPNLDAFVADLHHALGDHPVMKMVAHAVDSFLVYYVLNRFDGVKSSYDTAVVPFSQSLAENVSAHLTILNLGWVVENDRINEANINKVPVLLADDASSRPAAHGEGDRVAKELTRLAVLHMPGKVRARSPAAPPAVPTRPDPSRYLDVQLDTLRRMYDDMKGAGYRENFSYITARSLHVMAGRRTSDFGDTRIFKSSELQQALQARGR
jgi:hypothetical protein